MTVGKNHRDVCGETNDDDDEDDDDVEKGCGRRVFARTARLEVTTSRTRDERADDDVGDA